MSVTTTLSPAIELDQLPIEPAPIRQDAKQSQHELQTWSPSLTFRGENQGTEPDPAPAVNAVERWNESPKIMSRVAAAFFCFLVMGANDSAYGVSAIKPTPSPRQTLLNASG